MAVRIIDVENRIYVILSVVKIVIADFDFFFIL